MLALAGCGDPLRDVETISDIELAEDAPVRDMASDPAATEDAPPSLFGLFRRRAPVAEASEDAVNESAEPVEITEESEMPEAPETGAAPESEAAEAEAEPRGGFFARIARQGEERAAARAAEQALEAQSALRGEETAPAENSEASAEPEDGAQSLSDQTEAVATVEPQKRRGLFGLGRPRVEQASLENEEVAAVEAAPEAEDLPEPAVSEPKRRGLFGLGRAREEESGTQVASLSPDLPETQTDRAPRGARAKLRSGPDKLEIAFGESLPFGTVARVCEAKTKYLGRRVEKSGRGGAYVLYDSNPSSRGRRSYYITGFSDGCPRQVTAALAVFGAPSMHELLRYGRPSKEYPYSDTDKAYEKVKSAVCGVSRRKPCGAKIGRLERDTVFVTVYESYGDTGRWLDLLLHDGAVVAASEKSAR